MVWSMERLMNMFYRSMPRLTPGEDGFVTKNTGFLGQNMLKVGYEAPGLIYYKWDYSGVRALLRTVVRKRNCCWQSRPY